VPVKPTLGTGSFPTGHGALVQPAFKFHGASSGVIFKIRFNLPVKLIEAATVPGRHTGAGPSCPPRPAAQPLSGPWAEWAARRPHASLLLLA
jgi:hypothetical protein